MTTRTRLREHAVDDGAQPADRLHVARTRTRRIAQNRRHRVRRILLEKRMRASGELVQHDAEREDVGPRIQRAAENLLRRHVGRRAQAAAGIGQRRAGVAAVTIFR